MSLRLRLTLLYTTLLGGVLLVMSALVYNLVYIISLNQVDAILDRAASRLIDNLRITPDNRIETNLTTVTISDTLAFQVWSNELKLQAARPSSDQTPLYDAGLHSDSITRTTTIWDERHLRVISVPLKTTRGFSGILQIGYNLVLMDVTINTLAAVLVLLTLLSMFTSAFIAWTATGWALAPLASVTQVAKTITHANDLTRRIPLATLPGDEVDTLIRAFNQTLERLERLFSLQQRFVEDFSHDLRTPLTVIKGNIGLIRKMRKLDRDALDSIETETDRLARMVDDLLLLARAEAGRLPLEKKPVELQPLLLEVYNQMRPLAGERLKIVESVPASISGDRDRLKQVLINLIGNAIKYTPADGKVELLLRTTDGKALILVCDNGTGIPAEDLPHIFERFYRAEKARSRGGESGYGLGLSIAYWITTKHNGTIEVESQEGRGTTFTVCLPLND